MSKTSEVLRQVQRELALHAPVDCDSRVFKTEPDATEERELRPVGGAYSEYPPLDRAALRDGYKLCVGDARRLISDAQVLTNAGRYHSAHLILLLAMEELGSALRLYEAGRSEVQQWEAWWVGYFSHPKKLESPSLGIPAMEEAAERSALAPEDLPYVDFDASEGRFIAPSQDEDGRIRQLVEKEAAYALGVLEVLPPYAFERWEFQDLAQQYPETAAPVVYAGIEEIVSHDSTVSERDLLAVMARDLGRPPDDFAAQFARWKEVSSKARVYVDLLRRVQGKLKEGARCQESLEANRTGDEVESSDESQMLSEHRADLEAQEPANSIKDGETVCAQGETQVPRDEGATFQPENLPGKTARKDRERPSYPVDEHQEEHVPRAGSGLRSQLPGELPQPVPPVAPPQPPTPFTALSQPIPPVSQTGGAHERNLHQFIYVRYQQSREGRVDDITLDELLESKRISHFYRPSENRWVDVSVDSLRRKGEANVSGCRRRESDREVKDKEEKKHRGFFSGFFKSSEKPPLQKKQSSALEWFERGFSESHTTADFGGAVRAFALSIRLDPTNHRAYVNRGLAYEKLGNVQQAIEDYSKAISVNPNDGKVYYLRGLALRRLDMDEDAATDIKKAVDLSYKPAYVFLKSERIS